MEENREAGTIFMMCRRQVITQGMQGHVIDISIPAVKDAMDAMNIRNQKDCLSKVLYAFRYFLSNQEDR